MKTTPAARRGHRKKLNAGAGRRGPQGPRELPSATRESMVTAWSVWDRACNAPARDSSEPGNAATIILTAIEPVFMVYCVARFSCEPWSELFVRGTPEVVWLRPYYILISAIS